MLGVLRLCVCLSVHPSVRFSVCLSVCNSLKMYCTSQIPVSTYMGIQDSCLLQHVCLSSICLSVSDYFVNMVKMSVSAYSTWENAIVKYYAFIRDCLSVRPFIRLSVSLCLSVCLPACLPVRLLC